MVRAISADETLRADIIGVLMGVGHEVRMTEEEAERIADELLRLPLLASLIARESPRPTRK